MDQKKTRNRIFFGMAVDKNKQILKSNNTIMD